MNQTTRRGIALLLWIAWGVALGWSMVAAPDAGRWLRVASSLMLVAAAWMFAVQAGQSRGGFPWIFAGMTLGCLGDALSLVPQERLPAHRLLLAMMFFGLGHLAYIAGFLRACRSGSLSPGKTGAIWAFWLAVAAVAWQWSVNAAGAPATLRWSALAYSAILGGTTAAATALAAGQSRYFAVAVGAVLFLVSDLVLAADAFRGSFPYSTELCWATYGPGQMLIVFGMAWVVLKGPGRAS